MEDTMTNDVIEVPPVPMALMIGIVWIVGFWVVVIRYAARWL